MQYTIPEISNGVAKVQFSDGSWIHIELTSDMTEADLDDAVHRAVPPNLKTGATPLVLVWKVQVELRLRSGEAKCSRSSSTVAERQAAAYGSAEINSNISQKMA